jgi:hypothetical protein
MFIEMQTPPTRTPSVARPGAWGTVRARSVSSEFSTGRSAAVPRSMKL